MAFCSTWLTSGDCNLFVQAAASYSADRCAVIRPVAVDGVLLGCLLAKAARGLDRPNCSALAGWARFEAGLWHCGRYG